MIALQRKNNGDLVPSLLSDFFDTGKFFGSDWLEKEFGNSIPAVNIRENNNHYNVELAAPGFSKNDFKVSIENNILTISAEKKTEKEEEKNHYTRREFSYNSFSRAFTLPQSARTDKIEAKYEGGILSIILPKTEEAKASSKKEIKVA